MELAGQEAVDEYFSGEPGNRQSLADLEAAVAHRPGDARLLLEYGYALFASGRHSDAEAQFSTSLEIFPDQFEAWCNRAYCRLATGNVEAAVEDASQAIARAPSVATCRQVRALALASLGRFSEAKTDFLAALRIDTSFIGARHNLGVVLTCLGDFSDAITEFDRVLRSTPDAVETLYSRGIALMSDGRMSDAIAGFEQLVLIAPHNRNAWYQLATLHRSRRRFDEAIDCHGRALSVDRDFMLSLQARAECYHETGQYGKAVSDLDHLLKMELSVIALNARGLSLAALGKHDEVLKSLNEAIELDPTFAGARAVRGSVLASLGKEEAATVEHIESLRLGNRTADVYLQLSRLWLASESSLYDPHFAAELAEHACQLTDFSNMDALIVLAECCDALEESQRADELRRAIERLPR